MSLLERILTPPDTGRSDDDTDEDVHGHGEDTDDRRAGTERARPILNPPPGMEPVRGMRVRRIRLASFAKLALVFWLFGYIAVMASLVVLWNVAQQIGLIEDIEELIVSSLGLESLSVVGSELFNVVALGGALVAGLGLVVSVLLAIIYNAACALFGGLALETAPLRRRRLPIR